MRKYFFLTAVLVFEIVNNTGAQSTPPRITTLNSCIRFTENKGQVAQSGSAVDILYVGDAGAGSKIYFRKNKISYVLSKADWETADTGTAAGKRETSCMIPEARHLLHRVDMEFENSNPLVTVIAEDQTKDHNRYYLPQCKDGVTAGSWLKLTYKEIYPHIDIVFSGRTRGSMEYDIIIKPGADPGDVKIKYTGADDIRSDGKALTIRTSAGEIKEHIPEIYQIIHGEKVKIKGGYSLLQASKKNEIAKETLVQFKINGKYDRTQALVIDPWVEIYGGGDNEYGHGIKTDNSGNVIFAGFTYSTDFPSTIGLYKGGVLPDAFIVKLDAVGNRLWALFYGGSDGEGIFGIDVDTQDNVIVVGDTYSKNLPVSAGAYQNGAQTNNQTQNGFPCSDAFVAKFSPGGTRIFATYYGREYNDNFSSVATDNLNNIFISGSSSSSNFASTGSFQSTLTTPSDTDAVIVKFNADGKPAWATYYGGSGWDHAHGIEVDAASNVILTGHTQAADFPVSGGALRSSYAGGTWDAFIVKMDSTGKNMLWSTYYGGSNEDIGNSVAVDNANNILVAGSTASNDFPVSGAYQASLGGIGANGSYGDAFLIKLTPAGSLAWGTYLGGADDEEGRGIVTDANKNIYLGGHTYSSNFPTTSCAYKTYLGDENNYEEADSFVSSFDSSGNIICSSYLGGSNFSGVGGINDLTYGYSTIAMNGGDLYLLGITNIYGTFPYTINTYQVADFLSFFNPDDIFIGQVCLTSCGYKYTADRLGFTSDKDTICTGASVTYTITSVCNVLSYNWEFSGGSPSTSAIANPTVTYNTPGAYDVKLYLNTTCGNDSVIKKNYITVYDPISATVSPDTIICQRDAAALRVTAAGGDGTYTYQWLPGGSSTAGIGPSPSSKTTYTVTVSGPWCGSVTDSIAVDVYPAPTASFTYNPMSPTVLDIVKMNDRSNGNITGWQWNYAENVTSSTLQNFQYTYTDTGFYTIQLIVTDGNGCMDSTEQTIYVDAGYVFYSPNSFTPNGDGLNDQFSVQSMLIVASEYKMLIFDRWGNNIHESTNINEGWDGMIKGTNQLAGAGTYVWKVTMQDYFANPYSYTGLVTLIR